jgi:hypothetical protein
VLPLAREEIDKSTGGVRHSRGRLIVNNYDGTSNHEKSNHNLRKNSLSLNGLADVDAN